MATDTSSILHSSDCDADGGTYVTPIIATRGHGRVRVTWRPRWTMPTQWAKHAGNPVLRPSPAPFWDAGNVTGPNVLRVGDELRMYYGSRPGGIGMARASISHPHQWTKHPQPVLRGGLPTAFDANGANGPKVVPVTDTHWHMYYVGYHPTAMTGGMRVHQIGLAESDDAGMTWRTQEDAIVPRGEPGDDDGFSTSSACVLREGGQWYMWYTAIGQVPYLASICLATSDDGHMWRKHGSPVLRFNPYIPAEAFVLARPCVLSDDGVFRMWYSAKGFGEGTKPGEYRVCYAESIDGKHWERHPLNPVMSPSCEGWDHRMVEYAEVLRDGDGYHMWYCGDGFGNIGYARGQACNAVAVHVRTGAHTAQNDTWTDWSPLRDATGSVVPSRGCVQVRVTLQVLDERVPPRVEAMTVTGLQDYAM